MVTWWALLAILAAPVTSQFPGHGQNFTIPCEGIHFICSDSSCIPLEYQCDKTPHCPDGSDEEYCDVPLLKENCTAQQFQCVSDGMCIPVAWRCNLEPECADSSDELNCSKTDPKCDFECGNGRCIPKLWECDEEYDCEDHSDEKNCTGRHKYDDAPPARLDIFCNRDNRYYPCLDSSFCLPEKYVCDGQEDCKDGSDELPGCSRKCANVSCSHGCLQTPTGPYCRCPQGFVRNTTETCRDVDECTERHDSCTQRCDNGYGNYTCSCDPAYELASDHYTCRAKGPEGILFFNTRDSVMAYYLKSKKYVTITNRTQQTVGVTSDGVHVYWTEMNQGQEAIMRADLQDPANTKEIIVQNGLDGPEDVTIDWLTRALYFTDSRLSRIGVCSDDGRVCAVLIDRDDVHRPRAIALNPLEGQMYWSDWGDVPKIVRANMDGTEAESIVTENLVYPNGLSLDLPNGRLYWVDGHSGGIESSRLDGTDRQQVLKDWVHHPFWLSVFESNIYWSDWGSNTLQVCEKFTGKSRKTLVKGRVYGIHVYHPALTPQYAHACEHNLCSDLCLLRGNSSYTCVCSEDRQLSVDNHTCHDAIRPQYLLVTGGAAAVRVQYLRLGRLDLVPTHVQLGSIDAVAYNNIDELVYMFDAERKSIDYMRMSDFDQGTTATLVYNVDKVEDMAYDDVSGVLYWVDSVRRTLEVYCTRTQNRAVLFMFQEETPVGVCVLSSYGTILVALRDMQEEVHVDLFDADGTNRRHVFEHGFKGPRVQVRYHAEVDRIFISDSGNRVIESAHPEGTGRETFRLTRSAVWSMASAGPELFWTDRRSSTLYWANVHEATLNALRRLTLEVFTPRTQLQLTSITARPVVSASGTHPCALSATPCSHICLQREHHKPSSYSCVCPVGMFLHANNGTCEARARCATDQLYCHRSNVCVARERRCNGKPDCLHGEDEEGCADKMKNSCGDGKFKCATSGECVAEHLRCDQHQDCLDGSDEADCHDAKPECAAEQFPCDGGVCIDRLLVCDANKDCVDGSDEADCQINKCTEGQFQCDVGNCLPREWECDGELDCADGSDEHLQCPKSGGEKWHECAMSEMQCENGACVAASKRCDNHADCSDSSDERNCVIAEQIDTCDEGYVCETNKSICLPQSAKCNGVSECPHGEDEVGCELSCAVNEFRCADGRCISSDYVCDGYADCRDDSDEAPDHCQYSTNGTKRRDCDDRYTCGTGRCLDYSEVCNGVADCEDKSDEHGACETACQTHRCEQKCVRTPRGSLCRCWAGYAPAADGRGCADVDECAAPEPACAQLCRNTDGGFVCTCHRGYALKSDKRSCKVTGGPLTIMLTTGEEVWAFHFSAPPALVYRADARITDIAANYRSNKIYITSELAGKLYQLSIQPSHSVLPVTNIGRPTKVAVDWISDNVYVADNTPGSRRLLVCSARSRTCAHLHDIEHDHEVTALAVDAESGVVLYCAGGGPRLLYSLYKCTLDGRQRTLLLQEELRQCRALAVDPHAKTVYLSHNHRLVRVDYEGVRHELVNQLKEPSPVGLTLFENKALYISGAGDLVYCPLYGREDCRYYLPPRSSTLESMALYHPSLQPADVRDACAEVVCADSVCVRDVEAGAGGVGYHCVCADGTFLENDSNARCPGVPQEQMAVFAEDGSAGSARGSRATVAVIVLLTLAVLAALAVLVYYRLRATRRAPTTMTYAVHFSNRPHDHELQRRHGGGGGGGEPTVDITPPQPADRTYTEFVNPLREAWRAMQARVSRRRQHSTGMTHLDVPFTDSDSDVESDRDNPDARDKVHLL